MSVCRHELGASTPNPGNSTGQTGRRIFVLNGSNDADSRKDVPFGGFR